ncbi:YqiA/YcfP family alpha/beta fold hydrolase [Marinobacter sp. HL-58]|uniref:YqiA/YcfP family alpha/beta fold hydrolase n=1 Tax=Marinobacter sp. HL-58 TaxID=1479237 RepID=UPI0004838718|nr:YqiA/YcfP family alpha/beta fold hydrolase [Marinobacter sp. HL-58]KPQ01686.1 MAG: putative esterase [Marinobacter sp. HL-58]
MNIYYCHGFGSQFDLGSSKLEILSKLGSIHGHDIDYTKPADEVVQICQDEVIKADIDLMVGTSMGGWLVNIVGARAGIPFVAINPAIDPAQTLEKYIGAGLDYQGNRYQLTQSVVDSYRAFVINGCGLILLDQGDDVIDWRVTHDTCQKYYSVVSFPGGSHRFEHMEESLPLIEALYERSSLTYGLGDN